MSDQGVVAVRIGERVVLLAPETPVATAPGETPAEATVMVRCDACGAAGTLAALVTYRFYDDDHFGRIEHWYDSRHTGACAACRAGIDIDLGYTQTRYPLSGTVELSLDQLQQASRRRIGGRLVPATKADILAATAWSKPLAADATVQVVPSSAAGISEHALIATHPAPPVTAPAGSEPSVRHTETTRHGLPALGPEAGRDHGVVVVSVGRAYQPLQPGTQVVVARGSEPSEAIANVRCNACGASGALAAPLAYSSYDNDYYGGRPSLGFRSRHAGTCGSCGAGIKVDLSYTLTRPHAGDDELSLQQSKRPAEQCIGGTLLAAAAADILAAPRWSTAAGKDTRTAMLVARSSAECHLYMRLRACFCGEVELAAIEHKLVQGADGLVAQYRGTCPRCGMQRAFDFALDPAIPPLDSFGGDASSRIICPGEFALHSDALASRWPVDPQQIKPSDQTQARDDLAWAIRALEEVTKFIPPDGNEVPAAALSSKQGKAARLADAGRFRKLRLQARLAAYRERLGRLDAAMAPAGAAPVAALRCLRWRRKSKQRSG